MSFPSFTVFVKYSSSEEIGNLIPSIDRNSRTVVFKGGDLGHHQLLGKGLDTIRDPSVSNLDLSQR